MARPGDLAHQPWEPNWELDPGYAYHQKRGRWEGPVMVSEAQAEKSVWLGDTIIDGTRMRVFKVGRSHYAQTFGRKRTGDTSVRNRSGGTRNYEYVVYEETNHSSPQHKVSGFGKKALREAIGLAKIFHKRNGGQPAIYGISHGGWVGYINHNGRYQGTGTEWGKLR